MYVPATLEDHIFTQKGFAFKSKWFTDEGRKIVKVSDFTMDSICPNSLVSISKELGEEYSRYNLFTGDVIIQTVGSWPSNPASVVGKTVRVPKTVDGALLNQNAVKISPKATLHQGFLYYLLRNDVFKEYIIGTAQGAASQASITLDSIKSYQFALPSYDKQTSISKCLENYDNLIENNNRRIAILEEMAQSLYREWFVNFRYPGHSNEPDGSSDNKDSKPNLIDSPLGPIPEGWEVGKLESASSMKYGKMSKKELRCEEGIPIYSGYKITGYYPEANLNESKVIVVARGVGGTGDVKMSPDICWLTNLSIYIMENENILKKAYLFYQLKFSNLRNLDSGTSISQITIADLSKYKIIIPPIQIQQSFEAICCTFWSQIKVLSKQSENLKKQRDMLLPKLISGQIQLKD